MGYQNHHHFALKTSLCRHTPMDYDDNDISRHNLQLAGESRSKSSSVLRPYDFPKFDFDDGLQTHLRFDSLVETEVFLGIQSQEDNQWIEDFSRGSNGMEFNSTPADSCSISRGNNVWSEATSSESVEMLLKSVGQEEMIPGKSIMQESNASADHGTLDEQVEPASKPVTTNDERSNECPARPGAATLSPNDRSNDYSALEGHVEEQVPETEEPSAALENMESVCRNGGQSTIGKESYNDAYLEESTDKPVKCEAAEDSFVLPKNVENAESNLDHSTLETIEQVNHNDALEGCDDGQGQQVSTKSGKEDTRVLKQMPVEASSLTQTVHSLQHVKQTAEVSTKEESELKSSDEAGRNDLSTFSDQTSGHEVKALPVNSETPASSEICRDGTAVNDHISAELGDLNSGHRGSPEQKMDSSVQLTGRQANDRMEEVPASPSKRICGAPLFSVDDNNAPVKSCDYSNEISSSKSSDMLVRSVASKESEYTEGNADAGNVVSDNVGMLTTDQMSPAVDISKGLKEDDVAPHAIISDSSGPDSSTENEQRKAAVVQSSHPDIDGKEAATRITSELKTGTETAGISKVEVGVAGDATKIRPFEVATNSPLPMENSEDTNNSGSSSMEVVNSMTSNYSQALLGCEKSSLKEPVSAGVVSGESYEVAMVKAEGEKESAQATEVDKASCGSPTIISSNELSQMQKDNQEEASCSQARDQFVKDTQSAPMSSKRKEAPAEDTSFTFMVNALPDTPERETGRSWSPFPNVEKCNSSVKAVEQTLPSEVKAAKTPSQKTPRQSARVPDGAKGTSERKGRRQPGKGVPNENMKRGNSVKDTNKESIKGDDMSDKSLSSPSSTSGVHVNFGVMQPQSNTELSGAIAVPDLNTSTSSNSSSSSASFRQPFTDLQQVQLRAQIFVYGSLIQGTTPEETCMVSAFGSSDGRSVWEQVWRTSVERVRNQKSNSGAPETPLNTQSGPRASDAAFKQGSHSSKIISPPVARASSKGAPAAVLSPIIPLSSPLWSMSTPSRDNLSSSGTHKGTVVDYQHAVTPLPSYQTPPVRNFVSHTSWPAQPCFPGSWLASPRTSTFSSTVCFQPVTMTEPVKLTPVKDTSGPPTPGAKHAISSPVVQTAGPSPVFAGVSLPHDPKTMSSVERHSVDSKSRKRKKVPASDHSQPSALSEIGAEPVVGSTVATILPSPVVVAAPASPALATPVPVSSVPASPFNVAPSKTPADAPSVCSADHSMKEDLDAGKTVTCSEEILSKVAEAKSEAEDAAARAAAAVSHSEDVWSRLTKQKESRMSSEAEAKLVSAAVAIAAAASVAKAAAAAAKVAFNAALQAKLMADETVLSSKTSGLILSSGKYSADVHDSGNATPASILKGDNITKQPSSILVAAKEAARRRVEAASAASKQAENLDAIVKAAELAAAAVSQAGKIVAMGEPLPLSDLVEAGPEGYWKLPEPSSELVKKLRDSSGKQAGATHLGKGAGISAKVSREETVLTGETDLSSGKDHKASDPSVSSLVVSESDPGPRTGDGPSEHDELAGAFPDDSFKEGSPVEVFKHGDGLKRAWYSANILTLEDGKAYVCYTDLQSEEGSGNLCEWVSLEGDRDKAPIVRAVHPLTALQFQGTRKRRRAALGDYAWCVGDRVDVWIDDCWWEGVVTEKNEKDETTLKVHFPAQGETSTVRSWNLRSSRSWIDGKWIQWSSPEGRNASEQNDMPQEKRQKLGSPAVLSKGKDKMANDLDSTSGKPEESKLLDLSTNDRIFDVGKTTKEDNKRAVRRPLRSGQQKEGSRVIFGVPKPTGKKRKFMEVSKHFPARSVKSNGANDSVKFGNMPQATSTRGWNVPSRNDSKEKRTAESRSRVTSSRKPTRTLPGRGNPNSKLPKENDNVRNHGDDNEESVGHDENTSEKFAASDISASEEVVDAPLSSLLSQSQGASSKKSSSSKPKPERLNRGKQTPSGGKLGKIEEGKVHSGSSGRSEYEVSEPRRSNRRFQPTHRLLEGLQSSMVIPKMPSVSHDKGQKKPSRNLPPRGK